MRIGVVFHIHWWSRWKPVSTGGEFGYLRAFVRDESVLLDQQRRCRCGKTEYLKGWPL